MPVIRRGFLGARLFPNLPIDRSMSQPGIICFRSSDFTDLALPIAVSAGSRYFFGGWFSGAKNSPRVIS